MYIYAMKSIFRYLRSIVNFSNDIDIEAARQKITASTEFRGSNVWILIFAVAVASVGLNINSIPVVIGAMLISPLMGYGIVIDIAVAQCPVRFDKCLCICTEAVFSYDHYRSINARQYQNDCKDGYQPVYFLRLLRVGYFYEREFHISDHQKDG